MKLTTPSSRERIIEAANRLIYIKGFNQTSFADVAADVGISKGNLHYHFHSKDELLDAIVEYRKALISNMLVQWNKEFQDPKEKLRRFVKMLLIEKNDLARYGCPMGSLNAELGKCQLSLKDKAREMFDLFESWLEQTFKQIDNTNRKQLSRHLLAMAQGAVLMAYVYSDTALLNDECERILEWIDSL